MDWNKRVSKQGRSLDSPDKRERLLAAADLAREYCSQCSPEERAALEAAGRKAVAEAKQKL